MREVTGVVAGVEVTVRVGDRVRIVQSDDHDVQVTWVGPVADVDYCECYNGPNGSHLEEMVVTLTNDERVYLTAAGTDTIEVLPAESGS